MYWLGFRTLGGLGAVDTQGDFIALGSSSIPVGSANGTVLGTAFTYGATGTPTWSLTDATGTFQINSSTGVVSVLSNTDLAAPGTIAITISVSGLTPVVASATFNISVTAVGGSHPTYFILGF